MATKSTSTTRARRLRERRSRGIIMVAPVENGEGGVKLLVGNGLFKRTKRVTGMPSGLRVSRLSSSGPGAMAHGPRDRVEALRRGSSGTDGRLTP